MKRWYNRKPETMQDWLLLFAVAAALLAAVWYLPARFTSAAPRGMVYSPSGISSLWAYSSLCSRNTTGSSSRIADFSRPLAS